MRVGFHFDSFSLRGVTGATLAYARAWTEILGHESVVIKCDGHTPWITDRSAERFEQHFSVIRYQGIGELHRAIDQARVEALYVLCSGNPEPRFEGLKIPRWIHAVFPSRITDIHGDRYACVSEWLAKESFNRRIPFVPHIVDQFDRNLDLMHWREQLGIPANAILIGSMGGKYSFDLQVARIGLQEALEKNTNLYFVALNHQAFLKHERALFLPGTDNQQIKVAFITSCNAMLHGRTQGETFGLACAEFAAAGKPVFAWRQAPERHHLEHFCPKELQYATAHELTRKLLEFEPSSWSHSAMKEQCSKFKAEVIAPQFENIFANAIQQAQPTDFSPLDHALIFKRRLQRSLRARLSQAQQEPPDQSKTSLDPFTGYPMEE
jgi:hypothetical protein